MFDTGYNIIFGERKSGRTQMIFNLSKAFKSINYKTFFLGCTSEFKDTNVLKFVFDDYRFIDKADNNFTLKVVREILSKKNYNILFIDDIDYLNKNSLKILSSCNITIIATSLTEKDFKSIKCKKFSLIDNYDDGKMSNTSHLKTNDGMVSLDKFINSILREKKINSILDDKG